MNQFIIDKRKMHYLEEIKRVASSIQGPITTRQFNYLSSVGFMTIRRNFGSFSEACKQAGVEFFGSGREPYSLAGTGNHEALMKARSEEYLEDIKRVASLNEGVISYGLYRNNGKHSPSIFIRHFGCFRNACKLAKVELLPSTSQLLPEILERNKEIIELAKSGFTYEYIGQKFRISRERVRQVLGRNGLGRLRKTQHAFFEREPSISEISSIKQMYGVGAGSKEIARVLKFSVRKVLFIVKHFDFKRGGVCKRCGTITDEFNAARNGRKIKYFTYCHDCFKATSAVRMRAYFKKMYGSSEDFRKRTKGYNKKWRDKNPYWGKYYETVRKKSEEVNGAGDLVSEDKGRFERGPGQEGKLEG